MIFPWRLIPKDTSTTTIKIIKESMSDSIFPAMVTYGPEIYFDNLGTSEVHEYAINIFSIVFYLQVVRIVLSVVGNRKLDDNEQNHRA